MFERDDYTKYGLMITAIVTGVLLLLIPLPGFRAGGIVIKQTNILSDIVDLSRDGELPVLMAAVVDTLPPADRVEKRVDSTKILPLERDVLINHPKVVEIEDYSDGEGVSMKDFYHALAFESDERVVRIAMLGDSFIEGDIISADLREQLQNIYSGCGVGFVPFASAVTSYRKTIKHTFDGWETYTNIEQKNVPDDVRERFFVSCQQALPSHGAKATYEGVRAYKHISYATTASLMFVNQRNSIINLIINDTITRQFAPEPSPDVQKICVDGMISKLSVHIDRPDGFYGYGVAFEDSSGVCVDNYSLRGNSGYALLSTAYNVNKQIDSIRTFDLMILEYGLNTISPHVHDYDYYALQMIKVIDYLKECFPHSAILVMGIGDRGSLRNGEFVTMPAVYAMIEAQRKAAKESRVAFWSTFDAMGGAESMATYVKKGWAAKDYTHIGYNGGKHIATNLVQAIVKGRLEIEQDAIF